MEEKEKKHTWRTSPETHKPLTGCVRWTQRLPLVSGTVSTRWEALRSSHATSAGAQPACTSGHTSAEAPARRTDTAG